MRKFTEKDIIGLARAFQTFMGAANGQQVTINTHIPVVERALAEGILVDELLNPANYRRAAEISSNPNLEEYVDILVHNQIAVKELKDDQDWDDPNNFPLIAEIFHDFYMEICPKGGTWSTLKAKLNLQHIIGRHSLQAIMSEELINTVKTNTGFDDNMTCYQYVEELVVGKYVYNVDNTLSEAQTKRKEIEECSQESCYERDGESVEISTEGAPDPSDPSVYGGIDGSEEHESFEEPTAFISVPSPRDFKRAHVVDIFKGLPINEFVELTKLVDNDKSIDEFITMIADGNFDKSKESLIAANAHKYINGDLFPHFMECAAWQGLEISEEAAASMDLLMINWDLRDTKTRKLQKIKQLIYNNAIENMNDMDLMSVIEDLEKLYDSENGSTD